MSGRGENAGVNGGCGCSGALCLSGSFVGGEFEAWSTFCSGMMGVSIGCCGSPLLCALKPMQDWNGIGKSNLNTGQLRVALALFFVASFHC